MKEKELISRYVSCTLCPRMCRVDRHTRVGFCGVGAEPRLARAALHLWEEPCLTGDQGSGAIFFSGCTLQCCYCQNYRISAEHFGKTVSIGQLADIMLRLEAEGAANIDLITATQFVPAVIAALDRVKHRLHIPVVLNCGGYESVETLRMLDGYIDIYLPDVKFYSDALSVKYSAAPHYFETAMEAVAEMLRQTGRPLFGMQNGDPSAPLPSGRNPSPKPHRQDALGCNNAFPEKKNQNMNGTSEADTVDDSVSANRGILLRGTLIRHMVLPNCRMDSIALLDHLAARVGTDGYLISLLSQYTPCHRAGEHPEINRRITSFEYDSVVRHALALGMDGYMQERSSAREEYTPPFDLEGVTGHSESPIKFL